MTGASMKVCYFGTYSVLDGYPRNRILIKALRAAGVTVKECRVNLWRGSSDKVGGLFTLAGTLINFLRIIWAQILLAAKFLFIGSYDVMIVGSTGHLEMVPAKIFSILSRKPLIFEAFFSLFDTIVNDRGICSRKSPMASLFRWIDRTACRLADLVILDTNAHIDYFSSEFRLSKSKFRRVFVGADEDIFYPREKRHSEGFNVLFFGSFIPLHGIEHIINAAKILENHNELHFIIVGAGQELKRIQSLSAILKITNVEFVSTFISELELAKHIAESDACLGIFGKTKKADNVIPCKIFNGIAMKKPVITGNTSAATELLEDGKDALLCETGNAQRIAERILELKNDSTLADSVAQSGYDKYISTSSTQVVGTIIKAIIQELSNKNTLKNKHG